MECVKLFGLFAADEKKGSDPFNLVVMVLLLSGMCLGFSGGGAGTLEDPWQIATAEDLVSIGWNPDLLDKNYVMVADVNMAEYTFDTAVIHTQRSYN